MPDYASILNRSISALPDPSPAMREAVYARARAALARQLTAVDPPLSSREIENQHRELEDAVARLEADFAPVEPEPAPAQPARDDDFFYAAPHTPGDRTYAPAAVAIADDPPFDSGPAAPVSDVDDGDESEEGEEEEYDDAPASRLPMLVAGLILLVLIGGGAYAYFQRDAVLAFLGFGEPDRVAAEIEAPAEAPPAAPAAEAPDSDKLADRMTNGGEAPPASSGEMALAEPEVPPDVEAPAVAPPAAEAPAGQEPAAPLGVEQAAVDTAEGLVAQRAIYYYQGAEGSRGQQADGSVQWTQTTRDGQPAVEATLRLADRDVTATVTITRNEDQTLPASHLVEVMFTGSLASSPIQRVPALVLKQTEQARGEPLTGAAVMVTDELFWIALSDEPENVERNVQLLREGSWFDIPILFDDGTRALLTFEKGIPGDKVFESVLSAWGTG